MSFRKRWIAVLIIATAGLLMIAGLRYRFPAKISSTAEPSVVAPAIGWKSYSSSTIGLSFQYPDSYTLASGAVLPPARASLTLSPSSGASSSAITVGVIENPDRMLADDWAATFSPDLKFSNGIFASTTVGGSLGVIYHVVNPDDHFEADESVVARGLFIYRFSVTYTTSTDAIRADFGRLLDTVRFTARP